MSQPYTEVILNSIADGVFTVDEQWNITSFNRAAERITGVSREQALGQKCFDVFRADICQSVCALRQTLETGEELIDQKVSILNGSGESVPISISTAVLRDDSGHIVGGVETFRDLSALEMLRNEVKKHYTFYDIISKNHEMQRLFDILPDIAASDCTVLIEGPSGSGKELFARAIHSLSARHTHNYVPVNCGALPDSLLESELFGHVKGAFTDAKSDRTGRFARAEEGTIFLDEIGDISTAMQVKLLRVIQEREYEPLGSSTTVTANVRVIAATNRSLGQLVEQGHFREDLYYRLNVVRIILPPLTRRREDIELLADHFIQRFNARTGKDIQGISSAAMAILLKYDFPGNVRELQNIIEHAFVLCRGNVIKPEHLPVELQPNNCLGRESVLAGSVSPLAQAEAEAIVDALKRHNGNRRKTAAELGIDKSTLWRKMRKYSIQFPGVGAGS